MRIFLDTEFTDFRNPCLISLGLVAEDGQEFYCELTDGWTREHCTDFVLDTVLPLLDGVSSMSRDRAGAEISKWLESLNGAISLVSDTGTDLRLVMTLLWPHANEGISITGELLSWPGFAMARRHEDLLEALMVNDPRRHHALVDARALMQAVLQTEADFRRESQG
jgi:hypothetical protein